jgi:hypothetical protein
MAKIVELACWPDWALGASSLHKATARESAQMRRIVEPPAPPKDLGSSDLEVSKGNPREHSSSADGGMVASAILGVGDEHRQ